ncbi:MAG: YtxH domain-containing protein [Desulfuromonadales bacterium]|nr:YtxH domain-containing protein [Desulfuromonadales bacterium]
MAENRGNDSGSTFLAFMMGAAIGGGLALLFAPRAGEETREKIRQMADDARKRATDYYDEAENRVRQTIEEGKTVYEEKRAAIIAATEAGREAFLEKKEAVVAAVEAGAEAYEEEAGRPE